MTVKELNKIFYLDKEIKKIKNRIEELTELSASNPENEIGGSGEMSDSVSKFVMKKLELVELLNETLEKRIDEEIKLRKFINKIEDIEIRQIIELRFIDKMTWDDIASELSPEDKYVHRTTFIKKFNKFIQNSHISL